MDWNYQMGLGHQTDSHPTYPGLINETYYGEGPQRAFYRRWLEFMTAEKWPRVDVMRDPGEPPAEN
jgi:3-phenylpropionate/trans-cinnamate dioxygenase alpha subunit